MKIRVAVMALVLACPMVMAAGIGLAQQDKYSLKIPNGLAFADFRGYEDWQTIAVSGTEDSLKTILGNPAMIKAFRDGAPAGGKLFPEGAKIAKIEWAKVRNAESPYFVEVPGTLKTVSFIEKDSKRFPNTHGWAYAQFVYDAASKTLKPSGNGAECGYACHTKVAAKDYIFTGYPPR